MKFLLFILSLILQFFYVYFSNKKNYKVGLITKSIASLCFVGIGLLNYSDFSTFNRYIIIGLIFDALGDILLGVRHLVKSEKIFITGILLFLVGHLYYVLAFLENEIPNKLIYIIIGVVLGVILNLTFNHLYKFSKKIKLVGFFYMITISLMILLSIGQFIGNQSLQNLVVMISAILFGISDCLLIIYNFSGKPKTFKLHLIYSTLYYLAQSLIALSLGIVTLR